MKTRALVIFVACAACHVGGGGISGAEPKIAVAPSTLAFGGVYLGAQATQTVAIANSGAGGDEVSWTLTGDSGFSVESPNPVPLAGSGLVSLPIRFTPQGTGAVSGVLTLVARSGTFTVALSATGLADLACAPSGPCDSPSFDPDAGACLHAAAPDGTACSDSCLQNAQCHGGSCLGTPLTCDDGDACTSDFCVPTIGDGGEDGGGCQHTPVTCDGQCTSGACDPATGCAGAALPDGTACHLAWEPCVGDATCTAGVCDSPTAEAEVPGQLRWDAGLAGALGPFAVDDAGTSYFVTGAYGNLDDLAPPTTIAALDACGHPLWNSAPIEFLAGVLLDGDQAIAWSEVGLVQGLDRANGATLWETSLSDAGGAPSEVVMTAPVLTSAGQLVFAELGFPSQVAALWPNGQPAWTAALGGWAPISVAADTAGNTYVAFTDDESTTSTSSGENHPPSSSSGTTNEWLASYVQAFDPSGRLVMSDEATPVQTQLSVGEGFVFLGGDTAIGFDGGVLYGPPTDDGGGAQVCWTSSIEEAGLIDSLGRVLAPNQVNGTWQALGPNGAPLWGSPVAAGPATLADDGSVFALTPLYECGSEAQEDLGLQINALDVDAGTVRWQTTLSDSQPLDVAYLALTPTASLVFAGTNQVYAVFAGKTKPPAGAPWYRAGANNANTSAVNH